MSEQNKSLIRRYVDEIWNKRNIDKLEEFLAPNYTSQTSDGTIRGVKEYAQLHESYIKAFPDCKFTIDEILAEGDMVSARCTFSGTHKGELRGIPPTGKQVKEPCLMLSKISNGKFTEGVSVWDRLSFFEQLGVSPEVMKQASRKAGGR
jgi:steroid delta-isomerase-like uncharacterized protein